MNFKTTLFLLALVVVAIGAIFIFESKAPPPQPTVAPVAPDVASAAQKPLVEDFGDAVTITVQAADKPEWKFERDVAESTGPHAGWRMVAPLDCTVADWQVSQIATRIKNLKYTVRYAKAADGMSAEGAGLEKPRAVVTLVDEDDKKVTVEIGRNEGQTESYVRLPGADTIYRVQPSLKDLIKERALDYRDQQLVTIQPDNIVEVKITERPEDGDPVTYEIIKSGADWRFLTPAPAKAMADKIRTMTNSLRSLRAAEWTADNVDDLSIYGLDPAPLVVTVVTEEPGELAPDAATNGEAPPPAPVTQTHTVAFSTVSPLGDETKVYVRPGDERAVGTVMKSVAERFQPNLKEWRDNRLFEQEPTRAERITITSGEKTTTLERVGTSWTFAESGAPADKTEVQVLLDGLRDAKALNFETGINEDPEKFGFDDPRGTLEVAFAGDVKHHIVFGAYADEKTQRLVYARVDAAEAAHKLHASEVSKLLREPGAFRDRTVASIQEDRLRSIALTQPVADRSMTVEFASTNGVWTMTEPVSAAVNDVQVRALVTLLGNFHAKRIIDVENAAALAEYGLDDAPVRLTYTYQPAPVVQVGTNGETTTVPADAQSLSVHVAEKDGKTFTLRTEDESVVYEVDPSVWATLTAEYRKPELFAFDPEQVSRVTFREGEDEQGFDRESGKWVYLPEADIPISEHAVADYVLRVRDLKVARVVEYDAGDLSAYGLDAPAYEVNVSLDGEALPALLVSQSKDESGAHYAKSADAPHVFLLPADTLDRVRIDLAEFESKT